MLASAALLLAACATDDAAQGLPPLGVATAIGAKNLCGLGVSPEIRLTNVPAATRRYTVRITNVDALFGRSWQEEIAAAGPVIPEGAFKTYRAPCTAQHLVFEHRVEVLAMDDGGHSLAYGRVYVPVRSLPDIAAQKSRAAPPRPQRIPGPIGINPQAPPTNDPFADTAPDEAAPAY